MMCFDDLLQFGGSLGGYVWRKEDLWANQVSRFLNNDDQSEQMERNSK